MENSNVIRREKYMRVNQEGEEDEVVTLESFYKIVHPIQSQARSLDVLPRNIRTQSSPEKCSYLTEEILNITMMFAMIIMRSNSPLALSSIARMPRTQNCARMRTQF